MMLGFLWDALSLIGSALQFVFAAGALAVAVLAWGIRFHPQVRLSLILQEVAVLAFGAAMAVSGWGWSAIHHDRQAELEEARREAERLQAVITEQARQRTEYEAVSIRQTVLAQQRAEDLQNMQETVDDYEEALASGGAGACASDDAYSGSMRAIRIHRGTGKASGTGSRPAEAVPGSRPQR